jgi:hypothetical protein
MKVDRIPPLAEHAPEAGNEDPADEAADAQLWADTWSKEN